MEWFAIYAMSMIFFLMKNLNVNVVCKKTFQLANHTIRSKSRISSDINES